MRKLMRKLTRNIDGLEDLETFEIKEYERNQKEMFQEIRDDGEEWLENNLKRSK